MALTHLSGLAISGTAIFSGNITATASAKTLSLTRLAVSGTTTLSGNVTATAAGKTIKGTRLAAVGTTVLSGNVTATAATKSTSVTALSVSATAYLGGNFQIASAANGACGRRAIATGGSSTISSTKVLGTSRILLTPRTLVKNATANALTQTAGSFKIGLFTGIGTAATGTVAWEVVNL